MKRPEWNSKTPLHDYRRALQNAVCWLGERYLLAQPAPRLAEARTQYFTEPRRWHPAVIAGSHGKWWR
jgi:hypothetical protein